MGMKYLITGAAGALGSAIVRQLAAEGKEIRVLIRDKTGFNRLFPTLKAEIIIGSILNPGDVKRAIEGADVIFHCASFPLSQYISSVTAAEVLVKASIDHRYHIVYPGNTWVFGRPDKLPITPYTPFNPPTVIAHIKAVVDATLMAGWREHGIAVTVVHLPDFYGPNVTNQLIRPLFERAIAGKNILFPGPVDIPHQFIYIYDAARAMLTVAGQEKAFGGRYTVGGIPPITVREFCRMIYQIAGTNGQVRGVPLWLLRYVGLFNAEAKAATEIMHSFAWDTRMDNYKIEHEFGYVPQVSYTTGIWETVDWFKRKHPASSAA